MGFFKSIPVYLQVVIAMVLLSLGYMYGCSTKQDVVPADAIVAENAVADVNNGDADVDSEDDDLLADDEDSDDGANQDKSDAKEAADEQLSSSDDDDPEEEVSE